jgi:hypothetical protein
MKDTLYEFARSLDRPCRLYLAGPMSGYPDFNRAAFRAQADALRAESYGGMPVYSVISPVELDEEDGTTDKEDPDMAARGEPTEGLWLDCLRRDLIRILDANIDAVVVLEGWEDSRGAALEVHVARSLGVKVFDADGLLVKEPTKYRPPTDENVAETAMRLVGGDRQDQYGHPIDDFTRTAGVINALYGTTFGPRDIPIIMTAVKLSRVIQSPDKRDSIVDAVGYMLTYEMVADKEGAPLK